MHPARPEPAHGPCSRRETAARRDGMRGARLHRGTRTQRARAYADHAGIARSVARGRRRLGSARSVRRRRADSCPRGGRRGATWQAGRGVHAQRHHGAGHRAAPACPGRRDPARGVPSPGARLWECASFYGRSPAEICASFDSVYVSFYKTPGAISGAMLPGPESFVSDARVWQRRQGGTLCRQYPAVLSARAALRSRATRMADYHASWPCAESGC